MTKPIQAEVWQGDWGLPSIDLDCLRLMTFAKIAGLQVDVKKSNNPFRTPTGTLPVLHCGGQTITTYDEICTYVKKKNICPDEGLTPKQKAESAAYTNMLIEKLYPALQYVWWADQKNLNVVTRPLYCRLIPFPFNFYYPNKFQAKAKELLEALHGDIDQKSVENLTLREAKVCLTALSERLGDSKYMFGDHPSSIDATLFAYLAPLARAPFPSADLQNHLKGCTNLFKYVKRVTDTYYKEESKAYETKVHEEARKKQTSEGDFPNKRRNQFLAGLFAFIAMTGYALATGIVEKTSIQYDEDDGNDPSDYDSPLE